MTEHDPGRFRNWPDLAFHYGLGYDELRSMPHSVRRVYERALPRLLAEAQARALDVVVFPNMKPEAQRRVTRKLNKILRAEQHEPAPQTAKEMREKTEAAGIGIKMVRKPTT